MNNSWGIWLTRAVFGILLGGSLAWGAMITQTTIRNETNIITLQKQYDSIDRKLDAVLVELRELHVSHEK